MKTSIRNVRMIDGLGNPSIEQGTVVFDETCILYVGNGGGAEPPADVTVDGSGLTLLPGLMDCHVHLGMDCSPDPFRKIKEDTESETAFLAVSQGQLFLKHGITTVRNVGTKYNVDIAFRDAIANGLIHGPRIYASGQPIVMTGGHGHVLAIEADGVDQVRKAARAQLKAGADLLKLMATGGVLTKGTEPGSPQLSEQELRCACEEAAHVSRTTAAHAIGLEGIKNAIRAGITTIEHGSTLDNEAVEMMLERGTFLVPTLIAATLILRQPPEAGVSQEMIRKAAPFVEGHRASFRKALEAGVKIAAGTDAGTPFNYPGLLVDELAIMIDEGMTPLQAIGSATYVAAQCMNIEKKTGSIERGKWADLILVEGNPLEDIRQLRNIKRVYKGGVLCMDQLSREAVSVQS